MSPEMVTVLPPSQVTPAKVTEPDNVPVAGESMLTVATKLTAWPETDGLLEEVTAVAVLPGLTVWFSVPVARFVIAVLGVRVSTRTP